MNQRWRNFLLLMSVASANLALATHRNRVAALCYRCSCFNDKVSFLVDCQDMNLKEVPTIRKDLKVKWSYQLQGNDINIVPVFPTMHNLTAIYLTYNSVDTIADGAFAKLINLKTLDLSNNHLVSRSLTSDTFQGNDEQQSPIQILNLSKNRLRDLPEMVFRRLSSLSFLDLSHNQFGETTFTLMKALENIVRLQSLNLSSTGLKFLPKESLVNLRSLEELDLSGNNFRIIPAEINSIPSLQTLHLGKNPFAVISKGAFRGSLEKLKTLDLSGCPAHFKVESGAFGALLSLEVLWLNNNTNLKEIYPLAFANERKQTLVLKEIHLENNGLQHLSQIMLPWAEIPTINLQGNPWNCDCDLEWLVKGLVPVMKNSDLTANIRCYEPNELRSKRMRDVEVQNYEFICPEYDTITHSVYFALTAAIIVMTFILVIGAILLSRYMYLKSQRAQDLVGNLVKYKHTINEDEQVITSSLQTEDALVITNNPMTLALPPLII